MVALAVVALAGSVAARPEDDAPPHAVTDTGDPTKLDYLILASMVDSPHLLSLTRYHSIAEQRDAKPGTKPAATRAAKSPGHAE
jgi:hypothetical protein